MDEQEKVLKFKQELLNSGLFKRTSTAGSAQYVCQECPFCGDRKRHMYVLIDLNTTAPVCYHCFKCLKSGIINREFLEYFGLDNLVIPRSSFRKKIELSKASSVNVRLDSFLDETDDITGACSYIQSRIGSYPSLEELQRFQYLGNPVKYYKEYLSKDGYANSKMFSNRYWFKLTNGSMTGRADDTLGTTKRWVKHRAQFSDAPSLYNIKLPFDTGKAIDVIIAEGIMDVIGLYYNYPRGNNLYIAVLGRDYNIALKYLVSVGIFGDSVNIKFFKDADVERVYVDKTIRQLFGKVQVFENVSAKDYGVLPDQLDIQRCLIE